MLVEAGARGVDAEAVDELNGTHFNGIVAVLVGRVEAARDVGDAFANPRDGRLNVGGVGRDEDMEHEGVEEEREEHDVAKEIPGTSVEEGPGSAQEDVEESGDDTLNGPQNFVYHYNFCLLYTSPSPRD